MALKCCPLLVAEFHLVSLEEKAYHCGALFYLFPMLYLPKKTYKEISSLDLRYNALLRELVFQSKEAKKLQDTAASFNETESALAKRKLKKLLQAIIWFRSHAA